MWARLCLSASARVEAHHIQRLCNVKLAWFSIGIDAAVVVQAISEVGIFLDFADDHAGSDRMWCPSRNEVGIARANFVRLKKVFQGVIGERRDNSFLCHARL